MLTAPGTLSSTGGGPAGVPVSPGAMSLPLLLSTSWRSISSATFICPYDNNPRSNPVIPASTVGM